MGWGGRELVSPGGRGSVTLRESIVYWGTSLILTADLGMEADRWR